MIAARIETLETSAAVRDYLKEAVEAFRAGLLLASQICLGCAIEVLMRQLAQTIDSTQQVDSPLSAIGSTKRLADQLKFVLGDVSERVGTAEEAHVLNRLGDQLHHAADIVRECRNECTHGWVRIAPVGADTLQEFLISSIVLSTLIEETMTLLNTYPNKDATETDEEVL